MTIIDSYKYTTEEYYRRMPQKNIGGDMDNKRTKLNELLRYDFETYTNEEKTVFSNIGQDGRDTSYIDFDKLPHSLQDKARKAIGVTDLSDTDIIVIHKDLDSTAFWAIESRDLEEDPITSLKKALDDKDKYYADLKNLDNPEVPQEYKNLLNRYIDDYVDGEWDGCVKIPFDSGKGYLLVENDFKS